MLEILHGALVLFGRRARLEGAEVLALAGLAILLARIEPVAAGGKFADHAALPICRHWRQRSSDAQVSRALFSVRNEDRQPQEECADHNDECPGLRGLFAPRRTGPYGKA